MRGVVREHTAPPPPPPRHTPSRTLNTPRKIKTGCALQAGGLAALALLAILLEFGASMPPLRE